MFLLFLIAILGPTLLLVVITRRMFGMQLSFKMLFFEFIIAGYMINIIEIIVFSTLRPDFWIYGFSLRHTYYYLILGMIISALLMGLLVSEDVKKEVYVRLKSKPLDSVLIVLLLSIFAFYLLSIDGIEIKIAINSVSIVFIIISIFVNL
ncbi:hypothetical protein, partial [Clostridium sp. AM58-1XD]|uniref:hypothetical protein n=1 Tax=Clostridium sp. AM58-1XD TaxID=2292307 RepID=UPI000ED111A7